MVPLGEREGVEGEEGDRKTGPFILSEGRLWRNRSAKRRTKPCSPRERTVDRATRGQKRNKRMSVAECETRGQ